MAKTMNRAAQVASGRPSGIGACELRRVLIKSRMVTATCSMSALAHCGRHIEEHLSECCPMPGRDCSTVTRTSFGNSRAQAAKKAAGCFSAV